jgi:hypothetical protein
VDFCQTRPEFGGFPSLDILAPNATLGRIAGLSRGTDHGCSAPIQRVGRNPFAFPGDPTDFFGPVRRRKRQLSKSPAATFELENKSFASDGHSRLPAFPPAYAGARLVRRNNGSGLLWTTATRAPPARLVLAARWLVLTRVSSSVRIICENERLYISIGAC